MDAGSSPSPRRVLGVAQEGCCRGILALAPQQQGALQDVRRQPQGGRALGVKGRGLRRGGASGGVR